MGLIRDRAGRRTATSAPIHIDACPNSNIKVVLVIPSSTSPTAKVVIRLNTRPKKKPGIIYIKIIRIDV
jgi:hypothetical protein